MTYESLVKDSSEPLYLQLADQIKEKIRRGELKEGDRLMTELELSETFKVSRITVRKAIASLVDSDILLTRHGIGTFVASPKFTRTIFHQYQGFTDTCISTNRKPGAKLICAELIDPSESDIATLHLKNDEKIIRIYRVRYCDSIPVMLEDNHFSQRYAFLLGYNLENSLHKMLQENGVNLTSGTKTMGIVYATKQESEYLKVQNNSALLMVKDVNFNDAKEPVYTTKCIINSEKYGLTFNV
ncbi:MAG: GntR family transcriptional regulator [Clostridiales bacterium]|nr:GntR family transcriptional regulator [Clostridiales bacterium]